MNISQEFQELNELKNFPVRVAKSFVLMINDMAETGLEFSEFINDI